MISPTPRQQAGYLRRLVRRGELQIVDPKTGHPVQALIEIDGDTVRLTPVIPRQISDLEEMRSSSGWNALMERLRATTSFEEAEEIICAVEFEHRKTALVEGIRG